MLRTRDDDGFLLLHFILISNDFMSSCALSVSEGLQDLTRMKMILQTEFDQERSRMLRTRDDEGVLFDQERSRNPSLTLSARNDHIFSLATLLIKRLGIISDFFDGC